MQQQMNEMHGKFIAKMERLETIVAKLQKKSQENDKILLRQTQWRKVENNRSKNSKHAEAKTETKYASMKQVKKQADAKRMNISPPMSYAQAARKPQPSENSSVSIDCKQAALAQPSDRADRTIIIKGLELCRDQKQGAELVKQALKQQGVEDNRVESIRTLPDEKMNRTTAIVRFQDSEINKAMVKKLFFSSYLATKAAKDNRPAIQYWRDRPLSERKAFQAQRAKTSCSAALRTQKET
jgi:hypothetical protein